MSTPIKRIEKDFLLKVLYDEQLPVMYFNDRTQYILRLEKPAKHELVFRMDNPIAGVRPKMKLDLMFNYMGQVVIFSVEVSAVRDVLLTTEAPEFLYKNLDRSFSRVSTPPSLKIQFTFQGDRYSLDYPKIQEYESENMGDLMNKFDPKNLQGLIDQMGVWIKGYASNYKITIFKETKPHAMEERIIAETGKTIFLSSTLGNLPQTDPHPKKRFITEELFYRYLETTGVDPKYVHDALKRFIRQKYEGGFLSDAWVPILFQEYVIGYIHIWINTDDKQRFTYDIIETLYQFAKVLAFSLKTNGYFDAGLIKNKPFTGKIVDISASGVLFACPHSSFSQALLLDSELLVHISVPQRISEAAAKIVRRYKDKTTGYFGCRFLDMPPHDTRFLFEYLYGKPFTDADAVYVSGQV